jgi:hypothetical protein
VRPCLKNKQKNPKRADGVAQVVEHLHRMCKVLGEIPVPERKKKKEKQQRVLRYTEGGVLESSNGLRATPHSHHQGPAEPLRVQFPYKRDPDCYLQKDLQLKRQLPCSLVLPRAAGPFWGSLFSLSASSLRLLVQELPGSCKAPVFHSPPGYSSKSAITA